MTTRFREPAIAAVGRTTITKLRIGPTDLWAMTTELMGLYARRFAEKGLDFHVSVDPQVPRGLALDQVRIQQILFNLIDNAQKFTEQGGVELEISATPTGNGENHLRIDPAGRWPGTDSRCRR